MKKKIDFSPQQKEALEYIRSAIIDCFHKEEKELVAAWSSRWVRF